jgi:hypothetical protein
MFNINKYIGKNVKRKNLRGGYKKYIVIAFSDLLGYKLFEPLTNTTHNVKAEIFEEQFKIIKECG